MHLTRRDLLLGSLETLAAVQFIRLCVGTKAYAATIAPEIERWRADLDAIARDFRGGGLTFSQWHSAIEALYARVPLEDLITRVKLEEVGPRLMALGRGENFERLPMPSITGVGRPFSSTVFSVTPGGEVPPHAHNNQVTAHLILQGKLRTRTFERLHDEEGVVTVRPSRDEVLGVGTTVTMSPERENVHWFTALDEPAFNFQISAGTPHVTRHVNIEEIGGRVYLDLRGRLQANGTIEARVIDRKESRRLYGD